MISTPCINVCTMDEDSDLCFGCGRSRDEIAMWGTISQAEKKNIMSELPKRVEELEAKLKSQLDQTPMKENI